MQLITLGSGSSGNGYIIQSEHEAIIIECGMPFKDVVAALKGNVKNIVGCIVTHSHGDHVRYISQYAQAFNVYATQGTYQEKGIEVDNFHYHALPLLKEFRLGNFTIKAFDTVHDTKEPCGFIIHHKDMGYLLLLTDTHHIRYRFTIPFDYILIECNHTDTLIDANIANGVIPRSVGIRAKATHMSLDRCLKCLRECQLSNTKAIILIHISENNANKQMFCDKMRIATGKSVYIARKGFTLDLM